MTVMLSILLVACAANAVGDVALSWGARDEKGQLGLEALEKTPPQIDLIGPSWDL